MNLRNILFTLCFLHGTWCQTLEEKLQSFSTTPLAIMSRQEDIHQLIVEKKKEIQDESEQLLDYLNKGNHSTLEEKSKGIKELKLQLAQLEEEWKASISSHHDLDQVIVHSQQMELFDFIQEYSSDEYIYLIPQELRDIKVNISTKLPIPKASWEEFIRLALEENHIYIEKISPMVKRLYKTSKKPLPSFHLSPNIQHIKHLPSDFRTGTFFELSPHQLSKIRDNLPDLIQEDKTRYLVFENGLFIFGESQDLIAFQRFLDFVAQHLGEKQCLVLPSFPLSFLECKKLTQSIFSKESGLGIDIIPLKNKQDYFLAIGLPQHLSLFENLLEKIKTHSQYQEKKNTFFVTLRHIDVQQAAPMLDNFFRLLHKQSATTSQEGETTSPKNSPFIIDSKSNSIIGHCEEAFKSSLYEFIKKIDQPDLMVNVDILLFEKKISQDNEIGLSHLSLGSSASNVKEKGFSASHNSSQGVVYDLIFKNPSLKHLPAIDLAYKFIMSQKNLRIHANPSLLTCNKKAASISITDEISIKTGVSTKHKIKNYSSYERKEVGIKIDVTPIVQVPSLLEDELYITLLCNIHFDSLKTLDELPNISKRAIQNEVRVKNGETIILGGLKRKTQEDTQSNPSWIGEGSTLSKMFGYSANNHENTEMFICLSPRVVNESYWTNKMLQKEKKKWRPGESPKLLNLLRSSSPLPNPISNLELYENE